MKNFLGWVIGSIIIIVVGCLAYYFLWYKINDDVMDAYDEITDDAMNEYDRITDDVMSEFRSLY